MIKSRSFDLWIIMILTFVVFMSGIFISPGLSSISGALILILIITRYLKLYRSEVNLILPLFTILILGVVVGLIHMRFNTKDNLFLLGKDAWYNLKPVVYIMAGFYMFRMKIEHKTVFLIMIYASVVIALFHITGVISYLINATGNELFLDTVRAKTSFVNIIESFSLAYILTLYKGSETAKSSILPRWLLIVVLSASLLLSFSRSLIGAFIISLMAFNNFFTFRMAGVLKTFIKLFILSLFAFTFLIVLNSSTKPGSLVYSLTGKYLNTFKETSYLKQYENNAALNRNWRGFETHLTLQEIGKGNIAQRIFGYGFGKTVYIGTQGFLGKENINIPKFHNGFVEILLKTGFTGLFLYLIFFFNFFRLADRIKTDCEIEYLFKSVIVTAFFTTFVLTGLYNKTALDASCILLGYLGGAGLTAAIPSVNNNGF